MKSTNNVLTLSDKELADISSQIDHIATILGEGFEPLDAKQIQQTLKLHGKRVKAAPMITQLATEYGIDSPSSPVTGINADLAAASKVRAVLSRVEGLRKVLSDMALVSESNAWKGASTVYGLLQGESKSNVVLRQALEPVRDQLRIPRKKKAEQGTQSVSTTGAATTTATQSATTATPKTST